MSLISLVGPSLHKLVTRLTRYKVRETENSACYPRWSLSEPASKLFPIEQALALQGDGELVKGMAVACYSQYDDQSVGLRRARMINAEYKYKANWTCSQLLSDQAAYTQCGRTVLRRASGGEAVASSCLDLRDS